MKSGDWVVVVLSTLLIGALYGHFWSPGGHAEHAVIQSAAAERQVLPLDRDAHTSVGGPLGATRIEIHDGRARVADSPCNDKFCVHYGWLARSGEVIACLPNRVVMQLTGAERDFDAINF